MIPRDEAVLREDFWESARVRSAGELPEGVAYLPRQFGSLDYGVQADLFARGEGVESARRWPRWEQAGAWAQWSLPESAWRRLRLVPVPGSFAEPWWALACAPGGHLAHFLSDAWEGWRALPDLPPTIEVAVQRPIRVADFLSESPTFDDVATFDVVVYERDRYHTYRARP